MVNKEMNQRKWSSPDHMPRIAGQAHWLRALRRRLDRPMEVNPLDYTVVSFSLGTHQLLPLVFKMKSLPSGPPSLTSSSFVLFCSFSGASEGALHA